MTPSQHELEEEAKEIREEFKQVLKDFYDSWDKQFEHTRQSQTDTKRRRV